MKDDDRVRVSLDEIRLGATCKFEICDDHGVLLLGKGRPLTESVRDQIQSLSATAVSALCEIPKEMTDMGLYSLPEKFRHPTIALSSEEE